MYIYFLISIFCFSCGSLIFDVVLNFRTEVAEHDSISLIQNAIVDGKLGELSVWYIIGTPAPGIPMTTFFPKCGCQFLVNA